jgi:hypothetical protein
MVTRRTTLKHALSVCAAISGWPATGASKPGAQEQEEDVFSREQFDEYVALDNAGGTSFGRYYADDAILEASPRLLGRQALVDHASALRKYLTETISVDAYAAVSGACSAQITAIYTCHRAMPVTALSGLLGQALRPGQALHARGTVFYQISDGRFTRIQAGTPMFLQA